MSSRTAKKCVNENISLDNVNKKGHKKEEPVTLPSDDLNNLLNNEEAQQSKSKGGKRGRKKKQDTVAPPVSKIIIDLLNDDDGSTKDLNEDKQDENKSRNEITPSNSTSKMISAIPDSRANSSFGHITSRTLRPRLTPLSPKDNMMNIVNNSRNISNASQYNFNMTDEDNPQKVMLEELIWKVIKCELNSAEGIEWIHTANRNSSNPLQKEEIIAFVDESTAIHVLSQWLNATNIEELRVQNLFSYLCRFIQHAFAVNYSSRDTEKMKTLDKIMKNIAVPSRNGKNFTSNLKL
ncbi:hypothetical protein C1645_815735 [Glomus cerebriforme]|uniref:Uncharacterized protein n=1 Tax=Glomus cerebriforme TaxID=658196 RepID=A0A397TD43_9GLOM|nr:hypothetical protein C1645_815735 [Glomus cerebriforme]